MKISQHNKEMILVFAIILLFVSFSLSQTIIYFFNTPSGFSFQFAHNFIEDYYYYLSIMRQGWQGNWLATSLLTPEVYPPMFVVPFFLFLGHLARIFNLSLPIVYTLARTIGGIGLIGLIYALSKAVYPESLNKRLLALIFVCFGTSWWIINHGQIYPSPLVQDWTELDPIFRLTFIPHHLWSKVFMILSFIYIIILIQSYFRFHTKAYLRLTLAILFMGFTNPVTLSTFLPVILLWFGLLLAEFYLISPHRFKLSFPRRRESIIYKILAYARMTVGASTVLILPFLLSLFLGILVALYHRIIQNSVFPWTSYLFWEKVQYQISIISYLGSLGPLFILFLIGLPVLCKKQYLGSLLLAWTASGFVLLYLIGPFLPLTNSRYLGGYQFIPIGIGAVAGIEAISKILRPYRSYKTYMRILLLCLVGYFAVGLYASWRQQIDYVKINQNNPQVYLPDQLLAAFKFLDRQKPTGTVILAPYYVSTMIPAFTGSRVVAGHAMMTQSYERKREVIEKFYTYPEKNIAEKIIKQNNILYVLIPKDKIPSAIYLQSLHLYKVYENEILEIFKT